MQEYTENSETLEIAIEEFDTEKLPSLDDLMLELAESEMVAAASSSSSSAAAAARAAAVGNSSTDELKTKLNFTQNALRQAELEKTEIETALARVASDFEKYRWRTERERSEHYAFAVMSIVRELLSILDNFERAISSVNAVDQDPNFSQFVGGVELIYQQTIKFLAGIGVQQIKALGEAFDPRFHEAVATESREGVTPNTVVEEVLHGYRMGEKLIRPAMVKVSTAD